MSAAEERIAQHVEQLEQRLKFTLQEKDRLGTKCSELVSLVDEAMRQREAAEQLYGRKAAQHAEENANSGQNIVGDISIASAGLVEDMEHIYDDADGTWLDIDGPNGFLTQFSSQLFSSSAQDGDVLEQSGALSRTPQIWDVQGTRPSGTGGDGDTEHRKRIGAAHLDHDGNRDAQVQREVEAVVDRRLAFCTAEREELEQLILAEQQEKAWHEQNLRMLEGEKKQLAEDLNHKEQTVKEMTDAKQNIRDQLSRTADQNESDRRKLKLFKLQSQQERLDTLQLLQQIDAAKIELGQVEQAREKIEATAQAFQEAKADLAKFDFSKVAFANALPSGGSPSPPSTAHRIN